MKGSYLLNMTGIYDRLRPESSEKRYGEHLTPLEVFEKYIKPEIQNEIYNYIWVDMFAGEGNLIIPLLELVPKNIVVDFFKERVFMFDIQERMVEKITEKLEKLGIPRNHTYNNVRVLDSIMEYPHFLLKLGYPVYHITNPPYLYIGYIAKKAKELLHYFSKDKQGLQDLYQLAMMNDLKHGIQKMIYILPTNFIFGDAVSNRIRDAFLPYYNIKKAYIFERRVFEHTGTHTGIFFFERKPKPKKEVIIFNAIKINHKENLKTIILRPEHHYRASSEYEDFVRRYKAKNPLKFSFYLTKNMLDDGEYELRLLDMNSYKTIIRKVSEKVYDKVKNNILFVRTLDTGSLDGRAGLYVIKDTFGVDGLLVGKTTYRTHPIQIFFNPQLSEKVQILIKDYFNLVLEYLRDKTDSEFMTTYKYSNSSYTRKYLGLKQVREILETFPTEVLSDNSLEKLRTILKNCQISDLLLFIEEIRNAKG